MTHFPCVICRIHHDDLGHRFDGFDLLTQPDYEVMAERAHRSFQVKDFRSFKIDLCEHHLIMWPRLFTCLFCHNYCSSILNVVDLVIKIIFIHAFN
jgi:hypothetical protein